MNSKITNASSKMREKSKFEITGNLEDMTDQELMAACVKQWEDDPHSIPDVVVDIWRENDETRELAIIVDKIKSGKLKKKEVS